MDESLLHLKLTPTKMVNDYSVLIKTENLLLRGEDHVMQLGIMKVSFEFITPANYHSGNRPQHWRTF